MTASYASWPRPAAAMATAVDAAVAAARAGDAAAFAEAAGELSRVEAEQLAVLLGTVTRDLLERSHPDGLDADDVQHVLRSTLTLAAGWYDGLDGDALVLALTGALGIFAEPEPDEQPRPGGDAVVAHGLLLIADQLRVLGQPAAPFLNGALTELSRAQRVELP
jgi:hypothetical protein